MHSDTSSSHPHTPETHTAAIREHPSPHHTFSIGLPIALPHPTSPFMGTPKRSGSLGKRPRSQSRSRRDHSGEVSSDSEDERVIPRIRTEVSSPSPNPRRKIVNAMEAPIPRSPRTKRRETLQDRLAAAATPTTRRTTMAAPSAIPVPSMPSSFKAPPSPSPTVSKSSNDKVVVCMRIKPTESAFATSAYEMSSTALTLSDTHPNIVRRGGKAAGREAEYTYQFDTLVKFPTRTPELYSAKVAPMVEKAMKGFNSTVFAYGQTGSGKSHTMSGTPSELGIIPCAIDGIFDAITADMDRAFLLRVSYIEIYNETLRDLLNSKKGPLADNERPTIRTAKGKIHVEPLIEEIVSCPEDVVHLLEKGNNNRRTGATDWNERSSRSHAVFTIVIESRPRENPTGNDSEVRVSRLTLIDLAGSEKAVSDVDRRGEGKHINRSLLALREVVHKLTEKGKRTHIPYRDSKLTHLLENVLGGDSNICVICTMSAQEEHCAETLETLKFAGRCSQVVTKAQKNILQSSEQAVIRAKDMEIADLKRQLEELASSAGPRESSIQLADELAAMEARKNRLAQDLAHLNSQILTSELPPTNFANIASATPRKRRARISDVSVHSSASQFLGLGTPRKQPIDRRAVSTVVRVEESDAEMEPAQVMLENVEANHTDYGIAMSLRQTITEKEAEVARHAELLDAARADAAELPSVKSHLNDVKSLLESEREEHTSKIRDLEAELESTRAEHAQAVADKTEEIERLEQKVLEYCKSREDALVDDEERFDSLGKEFAEVKKERDAMVAELAQLRKTHAAEVSKLVTERDTAIKGQKTASDQLADLQAALDRESKATAELRAERDKIAADLETSLRERDEQARSLGAERDKVASQLESFQRAALDRESEVVSTLRGHLVQEREVRETTVAELAKTRQHVADAEEAKRVAMQEMSEQLATILTERETAQMDLKNALAARDDLERARKDVQKEGKQREKKLAEQIATITAAKEALHTENERSTAQVELLQNQLKDKEAAHNSTIREIESLRAGADVAQSIRAELDTHRGLLATERKEREVVTAAHAETKARADTLAQQLEAIKGSADGEAKAHSETTAKLEAALATVAELKRSLEGEKMGQVEFKSRAAAELRSADEKRKAEVASIRQELDGMKATMTEVTAALEAERKTATDKAEQADEVAALTRELTALRASNETEVANLKKELAAAKATASEVSGLKRELAEAQTGANDMVALKKELVVSKRENDMLRDNADRLNAELKAATRPSPRPRHSVSASLPNAAPPAPAPCPGHLAEIERLDKVVTAQKAIIEEQRLKIKNWADELEKQRDVVRMLTEAGVSPPTVNEPLPSIEATASFTAPSSPTPSRVGTGSKHARVSAITPKGHAYFGSHGSPAPPPIPTHAGQSANALRRARRITIEHDMDRLQQETGRVNLIKSKFDSPEKPKQPASPAPAKRSTPRRSVGTPVRGEGVRRM